VPREDKRQLPWKWHGSGGAVGLGRPPVALPVDLPSERDLGIVELVQTDVGPREPAQLGEARAGQRGEREQSAVGLGGGRERLLDLLGREDWPACS